MCRRSNRSRQVHTRRKISVDHISQLKRYAAIVSSHCVSMPFSASIPYSARILHQPGVAAKTLADFEQHQQRAARIHKNLDAPNVQAQRSALFTTFFSVPPGYPSVVSIIQGMGIGVPHARTRRGIAGGCCGNLSNQNPLDDVAC